MAEQNAYIRKLIEARDREVEQRRRMAAELAHRYESGRTEGARSAFNYVQESIEAIERAIQHERILAGATVAF
ncbi:MAG: hypothetical protein WA728_18280 [Xanthobacteraceae bacterium]